MKRLLFCVLSVTLSVSAAAQDVDSLYAAFNKAKGEDYVRLGNEMNATRGDTTHFTDKTSHDEINASVLGTFIRYCSRNERYNDVIKYAKQAIPLYEQLRDSMNIAGCCQTLGVAYHRTGQFDKAIESYYRSNDILLAIGGDDSKRKSRYTLNNIASIYRENNDLPMAEKLYQQCIEMLNDQESTEMNQKDLSTYLINLCSVYSRQAEKMDGKMKEGKLKEAIAAGTKALDLSRRYNDAQDKIAIRLIHLSTAYMMHKEYARAKSLLTEAHTIVEENNYLLLLSNVLENQAVIESETGNYDKAEELFSRAIEEAEQNGYNALLQPLLEKAYASNRKRNPAKALDYFERSTVLKDSIFNEKHQQQISDFQVKYETAEKELEIANQKSVISRQNTQRIALVAGLALALVIIVLALNMVRLRKKRNTELAEMNATKDKFFSIISHDLKNPALAQRNALQGLIEHAAELDAASLQLYYSELLKSADRQVELLFNLLNWAQVQTGRMPYHPVTFDLGETARMEINLLDLLFRNKGIRFASEIPDHPMAFGDRTMTGTVVRNLLTNAAKFTPTGGEIRLTIQEQEAEYLVSVEDTGIGMSAEKVRQLFQLDKQSTTAGTNGEQGSGLGLIVCKELVEKNGKTLTVESEEGKGSAFRFSIGKGKINYEL